MDLGAGCFPGRPHLRAWRGPQVEAPRSCPSPLARVPGAHSHLLCKPPGGGLYCSNEPQEAAMSSACAQFLITFTSTLSCLDGSPHSEPQAECHRVWSQCWVWVCRRHLVIVAELCPSHGPPDPSPSARCAWEPCPAGRPGGCRRTGAETGEGSLGPFLG